MIPLPRLDERTFEPLERTFALRERTFALLERMAPRERTPALFDLTGALRDAPIAARLDPSELRERTAEGGRLALGAADLRSTMRGVASERDRRPTPPGSRPTTRGL